MEERVGIWWHQIVSRLAGPRYPDAAVSLETMADELAVLFRALGGEQGIGVQAAGAMRHGARRTILEHLAGTGAKVELAFVDDQALSLPSLLDVYPDASLNRALYRWLAALCAVAPSGGSWLVRNQRGTRLLLDQCAGLASSYRHLVAAELERRCDPALLPLDERRREAVIRQALLEPGSQSTLPACRRPLATVLLWLSPASDRAGATAEASPQTGMSSRAATVQADKKRRVAENADLPAREGGLLLFRPESIFSWTEYAKVQHEIQENDDEDLAQAADDLDTLSVTGDDRSVAKKLRMTLDGLARAEAVGRADPGLVRVAEWDYRIKALKPNHCAIRPLPQSEVTECELPQRLRVAQRRLHRQLTAITPERQIRRQQANGDVLDLDACIRLRTSSDLGRQDCYQTVRRTRRDLSCLLLADLSLSTEAAIEGDRCVIDVIRDSLLLFAESLAVTRDRFALYGFSSRQRHDVRITELKTFAESYDARVRGRISQIRPAFNTRMGAAIRHASELLVEEKSRERLLLLLTDGKPNDSDYYEGRYGVEDTRHALVAARRLGLRPFCVTVDQEAEDYLPHIFGKNGYIIISRPTELPQRLGQLYAQLIRGVL